MAAHQLFFHLAWTTRERRPYINAGTCDFLRGYFTKVAIREQVEIVALVPFQLFGPSRRTGRATSGPGPAFGAVRGNKLERH